jgi:uncharacterized repeat protein (TIGR01451 family)
MLLRSISFATRLMLLIMLSGWLPQASFVAPLPVAPVAPVGGALGDPPSPAAPTPPSPVDNPHLPSLAVDVTVDSDVLAVGETAALTVTVTNAAPDPARNLTVTLPTPAGALAMRGAGMVGPLKGWRWTAPQLDANSSIVLTGTLSLIGRPAGDALLLTPQATADGVTVPAQARGGALVVARGVGTASFNPGTGATLRSLDGRVTVQLPTRAAARPLALRHRNLSDALAELRAAKRPLPPAIANGQRPFGAFVLDATDDQGADVHQFSQPLTITVSYSPEQLQVLGVPEGALSLFWFDETAGRWMPLPTAHAAGARTLSAEVDHFSVYTIGNGLSPSTAFLPTLQGFQVSAFTGAATYNYPIDVPTGPGGLTPDLSLSYSSSASDGDNGERPKWQAGWVGKGWSLDPGSVTLNKSVAGDSWNNFSLSFGGRSFDIVRGYATGGMTTDGLSCVDPAPTAGEQKLLIERLECWNWYAVDEQFVRVRASFAGNVTVGTAPNTKTYRTYRWHAWIKDGTRYDFGLNSKMLWWTNDLENREVYKWLLVKVRTRMGTRSSTTTRSIRPMRRWTTWSCPSIQAMR